MPGGRLRSTRILPLLLLLAGLEVCACEDVGADPGTAGAYPFVFFGRVLFADAQRLELRCVGTLSPVATMVAADSTGRIWGRLEPHQLAALDPERDWIDIRVRLHYKPDLFLITGGGKAYVTHRSPTRQGFPISVVDTRRGVLLRDLEPLAGRPEDLAAAADYVYLAAAGVLRDDPMEWHLYQIETQTDRVREVLSSADTGYFWRLAAAGELLYLGYLPVRDSPRASRVEVRDARNFGLLGSWENPGAPLRALYAREGQVLLFRANGDEETELLLLDPLLKSVSRVRTLQGPITRVLGVHGARLVYLDRPFEAGYTNVSVHFYDLEAGRELARVNVREYLIAQGAQ